MDRRAIARGQFHHVDYAVRKDGHSPAGQFLDALKNGVWDHTEESEPLDEQISDYHWFLNAIRHGRTQVSRSTATPSKRSKTACGSSATATSD